MENQPVKSAQKSGSIRVKDTTLQKLKDFVGETGKINAHADLAILQYVERETLIKSKL